VNCPSPYKSKCSVRVPKTHDSYKKEEERLVNLDKQTDPGFGKLKQAGTGGFATVFRTKLKSNKEVVAVKKIKCGSDSSYEDCISELYFLNKCDHKNIISPRRSFVVNPGSKNYKVLEREVWVVMEFMEGGTLQAAAATGKLKTNHIGYIAREVCYALQYLAAINVAHRDLKSYNIMLTIEGKVKLIDFGLAVDFDMYPVVTQVCGSPFWVPPEMFQQIPYGPKVDIWSLGICILELFLYMPPYGEKKDGHLYSILNTCTCQGPVGFTSHFPKPEKCGQKVIDFMNGALATNPDERMSASDLLKLAWLNEKDLFEGMIGVLQDIFFRAMVKDI